MGLPYVEGYKPRGNYQAALKRAIEEHLRRSARRPPPAE
jgi:hypothetical protein